MIATLKIEDGNRLGFWSASRISVALERDLLEPQPLVLRVMTWLQFNPSPCQTFRTQWRFSWLKPLFLARTCVGNSPTSPLPWLFFLSPSRLSLFSVFAPGRATSR